MVAYMVIIPKIHNFRKWVNENWRNNKQKDDSVSVPFSVKNI